MTNPRTGFDLLSVPQTRGKVVSAGTNTCTLDGRASSVDGAYSPGVISIVSGVGAGQCRSVLQYLGSSKHVVVDRDWKTIPAAGSEYVITAWPGRGSVNDGMAQAGSLTSITLNASASTITNAYRGQTVHLLGGAGQDQARRIESYNGTTKVAEVFPPWNLAPDATTSYAVLPSLAAGEVWHSANESAARGQVSLDNTDEKTLRSAGSLSGDTVHRLDSCLVKITRGGQSNITIRVKAEVNGALETLWSKVYSATTTRNVLEENGTDPVAPTARGLACKQIIVTAQGDVGSPSPAATVDFTIEVSRAR